MNSKMENPIRLTYYKEVEGKEVELELTVNGEESIAFTGSKVGAHKAIDGKGYVVWQAVTH